MALPKVEAGSEVLIRIKVYDMSATPPALFDPATDVRILLARPDESIAVNYLTMTNTTPGNYTYAYQTSTSDMEGIWTVQIKTTDGTSIVIRSAVAAFELISTVPTGVPVPQGITQTSFVMQFSSGGSTVPPGVTAFLGHASSLTETSVTFIAPFTGTIEAMYTLASTAPVGAESFTYRARVNGVGVGTAVIVTGAATTGNAIFSTPVTAGQMINARVLTSAGAAAALHQVTFLCKVAAG